MSADKEDALSWAGDEPAMDGTASRIEVVEAPPTTRPVSALLLITYGVLAGMYLIYTIGWVITVTRSTITLPNLFGELMFQLGELLAIASPAIWFVSVIVLTRERKTIVRLLLLVLGLAVVVPWPFLLGV